jgi:hypothetical protein
VDGQSTVRALAMIGEYSDGVAAVQAASVFLDRKGTTKKSKPH